MARPQPITTKPGRKAGELIVQLPPGWELRLRRVLRHLLADTLPNPREKGLTESQREARIVGKEVALATRNRFGTRRGSLREHVQAILREVAEK